ncbi:MAG: class I SAM-dependent methyltransferase [Pseudomonadota bacterium]
MTQGAFWRLHDGLPREGPGEAADVAWLGRLLTLPRGAEICDAACGPGADIAALEQLAPEARVTAFDKHARFAARARRDHPEARVLRGQLIARERLEDGTAHDPVTLGPFDLIWCAGAAYIEGIEACLDHWRNALKPRGVIAFSECCWFTDTPSSEVRAMWEDYPEMRNQAGISTWIHKTGFRILGQRRLSAAAWENYYRPLDARIEALRLEAETYEDLSEVLAMASSEAEIWRAHSDEFGYLLSVVSLFEPAG